LLLARLELAVVVLDDLGFVDIHRELVAFGLAEEGAFDFFDVDFDVAADRGPGLEGFFDDLEGAIAFEGDDVADLAEVGGDVDLFAVNEDVAMVDELASTGTGAGESHAIDEVVETGFEDAEEGETGDGGILLRDQEEAAELTFGDAVEVAKLLLLEELDAVFGGLPLAIVTMLAGAIGTLLEFVAGFEDGESKVAAGLVDRFLIGHVHVSFLCACKVQRASSVFPGVGISVRLQ